jgi:5-methylcytosine-specific restriction endonuclease McrA
VNVHHRTYEHHGEEHQYLDDLILLCHPCHSKFHGKLPERPNGKSTG